MPEHYAVRAASEHNYEGFYQEEMAFRREQGYPPLRRLAKLIHTSKRNGDAGREAQRVADLLAEKRAQLALSHVEIIGPAPCFFSPVQGRYRWQILVLGDELPELLEALPFLPGWHIDVDPVNVL
jgi:primosomal protein N' (replication factor Y)